VVGEKKTKKPLLSPFGQEGATFPGEKGGGVDPEKKTGLQTKKGKPRVAHLVRMGWGEGKNFFRS